MARVWTPARVEAATHQAEANDEARRALEFTKRLKALDPRLDCFLQTQDRDDLRAGIYYVRRRNDDGTVATWEISNEDGSYREPDERVIEALRLSDSWSRDVWRDINRNREQTQRNIGRERKHQRQESRDKLQDLVDYKFRTQLRPGDTRRLA